MNMTEEEMNLPIAEFLKMFENFIIKTANDITLEETRPQCTWFTQSEYVLLLQIRICNKAFEDHKKMRTEESRIKLKETRAELQRVVRKVKWKWQVYIANKCQLTHFKDDAKGAWNIVSEIMEGFQTHHKMNNLKNFNDPNGKTAINDKENARVVKHFYQQVFDCMMPIDMTITEKLNQKPVNHEIGQPPAKQQILSAIDEN